MENNIITEAKKTLEGFLNGDINKEELEDFARFLRHPAFFDDFEERERLIGQCEGLQERYFDGKREYRGVLSKERKGPISVKIAYDHFFLTRRYAKKRSLK